MSKFSKFTKAGIALVLVILTLLSTFTVALAVTQWPTPDNQNSGTLTFKYTGYQGSDVVRTGNLSYDYIISPDQGSWSFYKASGALSSVYSTGVGRGNVNRTDNRTNSFSKGVRQTNARNDYKANDGTVSNPDWIPDSIPGTDSTSAKFSYWGALKKSFRTINAKGEEEWHWIWEPNDYGAQGIVVPGFHSEGTADSVFGEAFGSFTNVAQCVVAPAKADPFTSASDFKPNVADGGSKKGLDPNLYGINNDALRSRLFYYFTPRMYKHRDGDALFDYQEVTTPSLLADGENRTVRSIGSENYLTDQQIEYFKDCLYEWAKYWYDTDGPGPDAANVSYGDYSTVNDEHRPFNRFSYIKEAFDPETADLRREQNEPDEAGRFDYCTTPDTNKKFHLLGRIVDEIDENGEKQKKFRVTYEDVFYAMAFCGYLTNDIVDNSALSELRNESCYYDSNGSKKSGWGWVYDDKEKVVVREYTTNSSGNNLEWDERWESRWGWSAHTVDRTLRRCVFNKNVIFDLEHAYLSKVNLQDDPDGWGISFMAAQNDGYFDYKFLHGNHTVKDKYEYEQETEQYGYSYRRTALGWGDTSWQLGVANKTRRRWTLSVQELLKVCFEAGKSSDGKIKNYYTVKNGVTSPTGYTLYLYGEYDLDNGNSSMARIPSVPAEVSCFYMYPRNPDYYKNKNNNDYYQVYMSSAIIRTPICIQKYPDTTGMTGVGENIDLRSHPDHTEYYGKLSQVRFKVQEKVGSTWKDVRLGDMNGNGANGGTGVWDVNVPDKWLDKTDSSLSKYGVWTLKLDDEWKAGLYVTRPNVQYRIVEVSEANSNYGNTLNLKDASSTFTDKNGNEVDQSNKGKNKPFVVTMDGTNNAVTFVCSEKALSNVNNINLTNSPVASASLKIKKTSSFKSSTVIKGAKFKLYRSHDFYESKADATPVLDTDVLTTDNRGEISVDKLPYGDYVLVEDEVPEPYDAHSSGLAVSDVVTAANDAGSYEDFKANGSSTYFVSLNPDNTQNGTVAYTKNVTNTPYGSVSIEKIGNGEDSNHLKNARFGLYKKNGEKYDTVSTKDGKQCWDYTDENGHLEFNDVPYGEYYLWETNAPDGYLIAPTYKAEYVKQHKPNVTIDETHRTVSVKVDDPPQTAGIRLTKKLITADNGSTHTYEVPNGLVSFVSNETIKKKYSYDSVSFSFYTSEAAAMSRDENGLLAIDSANGDSSIKVAENLKLDENGELNIEFNKGTSGAVTYYYREDFADGSHLSPMNADGNGKDVSVGALNRVYSVTLKADETSTQVKHKNWVDRGSSIMINKIDSATKAYLRGAVFKVEFFDKKFGSASQIGNTEPAYVCYVGSESKGYEGDRSGYSSRSLTIGHQYASSHHLRNDVGLKSKDGFNIFNMAYFPEGSYRVTEVQAPTGYSIDDTVYFGNMNGKENTTIYIGKTVRVPDGDSHKDIVAVADDPYVPLVINKTDADTGAKLGGAVFKFEYFEDSYTSAAAIPETSEYTYYLKTNANGFAYTRTNAHYVSSDGERGEDVIPALVKMEQTGLPVYRGCFKRGGTYRVTEIKAPDDYKLSQNTVQWGIIDNDAISTVKIGDKDVAAVSLSYSNEKIPSVTVEGSKIWDDLHNVANTRADGIRVDLYRDGDSFGSRLLGETEDRDGVTFYNAEAFRTGENGSSQYDYSFTGLPEGHYNADGDYVRYEYSIREVLLKASSSDAFVPVSELVEYTDDSYTTLYNNDRAKVQYGRIMLYNQEIGHVATKQATGTVNGSSVNWTVSDVPLGVSLLRVDIENSYRPDTQSVHVTKAWADENNKYQTRPVSIKVDLYRRWDASDFVKNKDTHPTKGILSEKVLSGLTLSDESSWSTKVSHLPTYVSEAENHTPSADLGQYFDSSRGNYYRGVQYEYYVEEVPVGDGYVTEQTGDLSLTNYETKDIVLEKRWNDRSDAANKRPTSVDFTLYREYVVPGYYTTDGESVTITKTVGTYTIDNFTNDKGSVKVTGQPVVASAFFDDKIAEDLGSRLGTDSNGEAFKAYETVGEHAIPCRYYVTESTVTGYNEPEYLDHTQATVQGVLTETIPVQNTFKVFDVVVKKYYRSSLAGRVNTLEAQLEGAVPQSNVGFVLGKNNGRDGVIQATGSDGVYEMQSIAALADGRNYFRVLGTGAKARIKNTFPADSPYIMRTGSSVENNGKLTIKNLEPGSYVILETSPRQGYSTTNVPVTFTLTDEGKIQINAGSGGIYEVDELTFVNDKIFAPSTGGTGNMIYYVAALLVLSLGVFGVLFFRRRRIRSTIVK